MDEKKPQHQGGLNLTEQQKQTVRSLRRQISCHSTAGSSTTELESSDHLVTKLTEEEISLLRNVVQTFKSYKADSEPITDEEDGRRVERNWSVDSDLSRSREEGTFVNPRRFYVHVTKEDVRALKQVCLELDREEAAKPYSNGNFDNTHSSLNGYENKYKSYGFSVALTNRTEQIILVENTTQTTGASPEQFIRQNDFSLMNGGASHNNTGYRSKLKYLPPRERFKQAVYLVINNLKMRPRKMDKDFSELWRKRGDATWLSIFFTVVAIGAFFADIGTDLKVAADHFTKGNHYWWGSFTLLLVFLPSVITNLVSFFWYKEDDKEIDRPPKSGWKVVLVTHLFLVGMVER